MAKTSTKERQVPENVLEERLVEQYRFFIDPCYDTYSFVGYSASYAAVKRVLRSTHKRASKETVVHHCFDNDFTLTVADCNRRVTFYFDADNTSSIDKSLAKIDRIKATIEAMEDNLTRAKSFLEAHPEYDCAERKDEPYLSIYGEVLDENYDKENGEWKRGTIKRR